MASLSTLAISKKKDIMDWFVFLFTLPLWFFSLFLVREKYTLARIVFFAGSSLLFGLLLSTGVSFPSGQTITTIGATTTALVSFTTYTATLDGVNSFPLLWGASWLLIVLGILSLIYSFIEIYRYIFAPKDKQIRGV